MSQTFSAGLYSDESLSPPWHRHAARFAQRVRPILEALSLDVHRRVEQIIDTKRSKIHTGLRSVTQLGREISSEFLGDPRTYRLAICQTSLGESS